MDLEVARAGVIPADQWHAALLSQGAETWPAWRERTTVRRFIGTAPQMVQPLLEDTVVAVHLGGPKRVRRWNEGRATVHDVAVGSLTLMPAFQANRWLTEGPVHFAHIVLQPGLLERLVIEELDREPRAATVADHVGLDDPLLRALAAALVDQIDADQAKLGLLLRESLLLTFAIALLRRYSTSRPGSIAPGIPSHAYARGGLTPKQLQRVVDFMAEHLAQDVSIADVVGTSSLSRAQFFRAFKQSTGNSPYRFLTRMRVERAMQLLGQADLSLHAVGTAAGFASPAEFYAAFRRHAGTTPCRFRAERR